MSALPAFLSSDLLPPESCSPGLLQHASRPEGSTALSRIAKERVGRCPHSPTLLIAIFDDSGSVQASQGNDPVSNRYEEARIAFGAVAKACRCKHELAAVVHFDTPRNDVDVVPIGAGLRQLAAGLEPVLGRAGTSEIGPSLWRARVIAAQHPDHRATLVVFSDFELFDPEPSKVAADLRAFPGRVHAVVLGSGQSQLVNGADVTTTVDTSCQPGSVAYELLADLTEYRHGWRTRGRKR